MALTKVDSQLVSGAITTDSSGNVGIGTASPTNKLDVRSSQPTINAQATTNGNAGLLQLTALSSDGSNTCAVQVIGASIGNNSASNMIFKNDGGSGLTERMRIDSSGNLLVGVSATISGGGSAITGSQTVGQQILTIQKSNQTINQNNNYYMQFNGSNGVDGYINTNGSAVLVISDASDERVKENIVDATYGLHTIKSLRPVEYSRIGETQRIKGFIAQEVKKVIPECVSIKDDSETSGLSDMHILEMQTMIPVMVKAIQELNAKVDAQAAEIQALKATNV